MVSYPAIALTGTKQNLFRCSDAHVPHLPLLPPDLEQAAAHGVPHPLHPVHRHRVHRRARLAQPEVGWQWQSRTDSQLLQSPLVDRARRYGTVRAPGHFTQPVFIQCSVL